MKDEQSRGRLARAVKGAYDTLRPFRESTHALVKEYAGPGYGKGEVRREQYLNLMQQAVDAYVMALAANRPKVIVSTHHPELKGFAHHFALATNNLCKEIGLERTLRAWLVDAFFCLGIIKVHLADSALIEIEPDIFMDPGIPFASNVSLDDFVFDVGAQRLGQVKFFGDMYRIPFEDLKSGFYDEQVTRHLRPTSKRYSDGQRLEDISRGDETDEDEFEPMIDLCDIYIPREQMIYTFAVKDRDHFQIHHAPLAELEWTGFEEGPYHLLGFSDVPDNVMPASLADQLSSLSRLSNNLMRKQARRARNQKSIHAFSPMGADDAKRLRTAADNEFVQVQNPAEISRIDFNGPDPILQQFLINSIDLFDRGAGNLQALLGLGTNAGTVGQEQLIHTAASKKVAQMQTRYVEAIEKVVKQLGTLLWNDEFLTIPGTIEIPGAPGYEVQSNWSPLDREGSLVDYNMTVDVYSMQYRGPEQRTQQTLSLIQNVFAPLLPILQQQGGSLDLLEVTKMLSEMLDEPRLRDIVKFYGEPIPPDSKPQSEVRKSPTSQREYIRRNVSSGRNEQSQAWASLARSNES